MLPARLLTLINKAVFQGGGQFPNGSQIIRIIGRIRPRQPNMGTVMKVIVPQRVERISALLDRLKQCDVLGFIFSSEINLTSPGCFFRCALNGDQDVFC